MLQVLTHNTECESFLLVAQLEDKDYRKARCFHLCPCLLYIHAQPLLLVRFSKTSEPWSFICLMVESLGPEPIPCCSVCPGPQAAGMMVCLQTLQALSFILAETPGSHCDGKCVCPRILFLSLGEHDSMHPWLTPAPLHIRLLSHVLFSARQCLALLGVSG